MSSGEDQKTGSSAPELTRREVMVGAAAVGAAAAVGLPTRARAMDEMGPPDLGSKRYNVLLIVTDQERFLREGEKPKSLSLPGRARLRAEGIDFRNHQIASAVCSSSRSVIYTGQHIQTTTVFDNCNMDWSNDLPLDLPNLGTMLKSLGYATAYKGKWHMSLDMDTTDMMAMPDVGFNKDLAAYGFDDYIGIGDVIGMTEGGYINDDLIAAQAQRWLRLKARTFADEGRPWFLAMNLVNPHDVMFFDTDVGDDTTQATPTPMMALRRTPSDTAYQAKYEGVLSASRHDPVDGPGRPPAHKQYLEARGALVGVVPSEDERYQRLMDFYYNCIKATDRSITVVLDELERLGLRESTVVIFTADHGELGGAHGLTGKGTTAYREQNHVPFVVSHPAIHDEAGIVCRAVTSHLDLTPTILACANAGAEDLIAKLPGHNALIAGIWGEEAPFDMIRDGALYCMNMFLYADGEYLGKVRDFVAQGGSPHELGQQDFHVDFKYRSAIRSVFDGRYRFTRYFSPLQHNTPKNTRELFALNDVELYDLQEDPDERVNLAADPKKHAALIKKMNRKLNKLIETEVQGPDDGHSLPDMGVSWHTTTFSI